MINARRTFVPPALCSESAGMNEPYFAARIDKYAAQ